MMRSFFIALGFALLAFAAMAQDAPLTPSSPGGRLTLVGGGMLNGGGCDVVTDQVAASTIYYSPCGSEWVPIFDGTSMAARKFTSSATDATGLSVRLGTSWAANTIYGWFVGLNAGVPTLCSGPAWGNSAVGLGDRGAAEQIGLYEGTMVNVTTMECRSANDTTFVCQPYQCTYLGDIMTGALAGTVDLKFGTDAPGGGAAVLSVCNAYNRRDVRAAVSDTSAAWSYGGSNWRAADGGATQIRIVSCMGDIQVHATYTDYVTPSQNGVQPYIGIGSNSCAQLALRATSATTLNTQNGGVHLTSMFDEVMSPGLNLVCAIEMSVGASPSRFSGQYSPTNMQQLSLTARM